MTEVGSVYGQALYDLAKEAALTHVILQQLSALNESFSQEPAFLRLLAAPSLTKEERCRILDDSFRGKIEPYLLNFLKLLTEKGYARHFSHCFSAYEEQYNQDNGILPVTAVTAVALSEEQAKRLSDKLAGITGKTIALRNHVDPQCLGGIRLDYNGTRLDDTVAHRLESIRNMLKSTVL